MQISSPATPKGSTAPSSAAVPKKRIALMLSGLPRQWRVSLQSQLFSLRNHQVDVFFHFWDTIDAAEKDEIVALLKPRAYSFETPRDFLSEDKNPLYRRDKINLPSRLFSQYYSWREVANLMEPYKADYDLAVRSRSDLTFVRDIDSAIQYMDFNDIFTPRCVESEMMVDLLAFGDVEGIIYYHKMFDHLSKLSQGRLFNPEFMLKAHMEACPNIRILNFDDNYFFVRRPHMQGYSVEQALLEDPRLNKWLDPEMMNEYRDLHHRLDGDAGAKNVEFFGCFQAKRLMVEIAAKISGMIAEKVEAIS